MPLLNQPQSFFAVADPLAVPNRLHTVDPALQIIYDTAPIGLAFLSPEGRYIRINKRLTEICNVSVEDHIGRTVR